MDGEAWYATVHGVAETQTRLSDFNFNFTAPVDHILSDLSTRTRPSWVVPRAWLSFIELDKAVVHVISLISFL